MKIVYEAKDSVEAGMIVSLLHESSLTAEMVHDNLQGLNPVHVLVPESEFAEARRVIEEWEASPNAQSLETPKPSGSGNTFGKPALIFVFVLGLLAGAVVGPVVTKRLAAQQQGGAMDRHDYNGDGKPDEWIHYKYGVPRKQEIDRNFDSVVDCEYQFSRDGRIEASKSDDDFDGTFEGVHSYEFHNPVKSEYDTDRDGDVDLVYEFKNGVLWKEIFLGESGKPVKVSTFEMQNIVESKLDRDGDGEFEIVRKHDGIGEIVE